MSLLMEGGSLRRLAFSASKRLSMPSFSKRSTLRYRVRSAEPVSRALSATEVPNSVSGRISS